MTEGTFNAVLKTDEQMKTFLPVAHNLYAEEAEAKVNELKGKDIKAQILPQAEYHKGWSLKTCKLCETAAHNLSQKEVPDVLEEEDDDEAEENQ